MNKRVRTWFMVVALCALAGCAAATSKTGGGVIQGHTLKSNSKIALMPIPDGIEAREGAAGGTGVAMHASVRDTLIQAGQSPMPIEAAGLDAAFAQARNLGCDYVLKATITEWEDNATEWSGRPDSAALSAELYDVASASLVSTSTHREQASTAALFAASPERFMSILSARVVERLLGVILSGNK